MAFPTWFLPWIHINNKYNVHLEVGREREIEREREFSRRRRELFYRKFHEKGGTTTMAKDLTTTKYEPIQPEGLALGLLVLTIVFTILSSIVAGLRFYVRISMRSFAVEDWMMLAGWVSLALL